MIDNAKFVAAIVGLTLLVLTFLFGPKMLMSYWIFGDVKCAFIQCVVVK